MAHLQKALDTTVGQGKTTRFPEGISKGGSHGQGIGACMIVNEDDGPGRQSFIGWFGNPHTKQIDTAGDLLLMGE